MSVIPCEKNLELQQMIEDYANVLKNEAHKLGNHGLLEQEFYEKGIFRGAIEIIRGQFSATMREKRDFVRHILNFMQDKKYIREWESAGEANRFDYIITLNNGRTAIIELKGCLDGNNTIIYERPPNAHEFIIWSVCTNPGADPQHNVWSGIHTRMSAEIISKNQSVDGLVVWDWMCNAACRICPKLAADHTRVNNIGPYILPPPCIYLFPATIPSPRNNSAPPSQKIEDVMLLKALHECFGGHTEELNYVQFEVAHNGADTVRKTRIERNGKIQKESRFTAIRRS